MVIGLYVPSMCEKASASAIFCGASFVDALCFSLSVVVIRPTKVSELGANCRCKAEMRQLVQEVQKLEFGKALM